MSADAPARTPVDRADLRALTLRGEPAWETRGHLLRPAAEADLLAHLGWCRERATLLAACPAVRGTGMAETCRTIAERLGEAARLLTGEGD